MSEFAETAELMTLKQLEAVTAGYVDLLNTHVLLAEEIRSKIKTLRDIQQRKMLIKVNKADLPEFFR